MKPKLWGNKCPRIVILGAGCTGLGAAYRLHELGYSNFLVIERNSYPGGLAASFIDERGFTWDLGGHVQFSHYEYFDRMMERALGTEWLHHERQSYIWASQRFVPYPFQNNLRHLPLAEQVRCIRGLIRARASMRPDPRDFRDWILSSFGEGIAETFLLPYNFKVWAHPCEVMDYRWVGERVALVDLERVIENVVSGKDDPGWGPNSTFRFPASGGTGAIWKSVANFIPEGRFSFNSTVRRIDGCRQGVVLHDGSEHAYDVLISTIPVDQLAQMLGDTALARHTANLRYSTTHVIGVGLAGQPPPHLHSKNWMYFPEADCPFYRVTVFSNYSPRNVPDSSKFWSLMAEVSESAFKSVDEGALTGDVMAGLVATRLIESGDKASSVWHKRLRRGYPVPTLDRDEHLAAVLPRLEARNIYSRGRFGLWKYEVANQDHSCMQGVELVNRLLFGTPELTAFHPGVVNALRPRISSDQDTATAGRQSPGGVTVKSLSDSSCRTTSCAVLQAS